MKSSYLLFRFIDFLWTETNSTVGELALTASLKILLVAEDTRYITSKLKIDYYLEKWNQYCFENKNPIVRISDFLNEKINFTD